MKIKMMALAGLLAVSSIASAQSVTVGYAVKSLDNNAGQTHLTSLSVKNKLFGNVSGDLGLSADKNDATNALVNRYEVGGTYNQPLFGTVSGDFRLATGWKAKSGSEVTSYYVIEPSVTAKIPSTAASVKVGYRWRNAWASDVADNSTTTRLAVAYDITAKDKISLGRDWLRGDGANTQTTLQYTRAF